MSIVKGGGHMFAPKNAERVWQASYDGFRCYYLRFGYGVNIGLNCVKPVKVSTLWIR